MNPLAEGESRGEHAHREFSAEGSPEVYVRPQQSCQTSAGEAGAGEAGAPPGFISPWLRQP